jgi:hypothetical protein
VIPNGAAYNLPAMILLTTNATQNNTARGNNHFRFKDAPFFLCYPTGRQIAQQSGDSYTRTSLT